MQESPLFTVPVREGGASSPRALVRRVRSIRKRIARLGIVASVVASLAGNAVAVAAPPFDATNCTNGTIACLPTGGAIYPYLADPSVLAAGGYNVGVPFAGGVPFYGGQFSGGAFGYGYGNPYPVGPGFVYNGAPSGQCFFVSGEICNAPPGSIYAGYNVSPPPTAAPFTAFPASALITPPVPAQFAPQFPGQFPGQFAPPAGVAVATLPPPAPPGIPAAQPAQSVPQTSPTGSSVGSPGQPVVVVVPPASVGAR